MIFGVLWGMNCTVPFQNSGVWSWYFIAGITVTLNIFAVIYFNYKAI